MSRAPEPFTGEEIAERAFVESMIDSIHGDVNNHADLEVAIEFTQAVIDVRERLNRNQCDRQGSSENTHEASGETIHMNALGRTALLEGREEEFRVFSVYHLGQMATLRLAQMSDTTDIPMEYKLLDQEREWAHQEIASANGKLVKKIAGKTMYARSLSSDQLMLAGNLGLNRAIEKFRPDLGTKFSTYADTWVRQAMQQEDVVAVGSMRMPTADLGLYRQARRARGEHEQQTGVRLTEDELAARLGVTVEKLRSANLGYERARNATNLDAEFREGDDRTHGDMIGYVETGYADVELADTIRALVEIAAEDKVSRDDVILFVASAGLLGDLGTDMLRERKAMNRDLVDRRIRRVRSKFQKNERILALLNSSIDEV